MSSKTGRRSGSPLFVRTGKHCERETGIPPSSQKYLVEKGILPPPIRLSERIAGWTWDELEAALEARRNAPDAA
jgi:predicted DNA-binding transcriptional regulator AlpA